MKKLKKCVLAVLMAVAMVVSLLPVSDVYADTTGEWVVYHEGYDTEGDYVTLRYYQVGNTYTQVEAVIDATWLSPVTISGEGNQDYTLSEEAATLLERATTYRDAFLTSTSLTRALDSDTKSLLITFRYAEDEFMMLEPMVDLYVDGWTQLDLVTVYEDGAESYTRYPLYRVIRSLDLEGIVTQNPLPGPGQQGTSGSGTGTQSPSVDGVVTPSVPSVESEHTLANGEEVRMITVKGNSSVYVIAKKDILPTGATFESVLQKTGEIFNNAASAVKEAFGNADFCVYEMNLYDATNQAIHNLNDYINVTLPVPAGMATGEGETIVVYCLENGKLKKCDTAVANGQVTFATNHFSTYILVEVNAMTSPKTGDSSIAVVFAVIALASLAALAGTKARKKM